GSAWWPRSPHRSAHGPYRAGIEDRGAFRQGERHAANSSGTHLLRGSGRVDLGKTKGRAVDARPGVLRRVEWPSPSLHSQLLGDASLEVGDKIGGSGIALGHFRW